MIELIIQFIGQWLHGATTDLIESGIPNNCIKMFIDATKSQWGQKNLDETSAEKKNTPQDYNF